MAAHTENAAMRQHSFSVGQSVELVSGRLSGNIPGGSYVVLRQLPNDGQDREYRVKNARDGHERVVRESEVRGDTGPLSGERDPWAGSAAAGNPGTRARRP
ncbi:hypothetical protein [Plastoroseomonas hellenica]|uniref:hypothetical protein n=1 Tax=Plastoroseomonas hellenica TaxID=2687306 RepID=UPI001BAC08A4|nr:hypothetical protein [Plastoroseomonas hellenica]